MNASDIPNLVQGLERAAAEVSRLLSMCDRSPAVVGISGPVGSGKTTFAGRLGACVLSTDAYLPDYQTVAPHERDLPESADFDLLVRNIRELRSTGRTRVPVWSFTSHRREGDREVWWTEGPIVVEGIHSLDHRLRSMLDVKVLVEADAAERWARWEVIESRGERGWGVERAREHFTTVAEPTFHARASELRAIADLIVWNSGAPPLTPCRD